MIKTVLKLKRLRQVTPTVFEITLSGKIPPFTAGQFVHIAIPGFLLRRPFCITEGNDREITVLFAVVGAGTCALSKLTEGVELDCILPIGNGFSLDRNAKNIMIIGGGLGVAPLLPVLSQYPDKNYCVLLGFGSASQMIEAEAFSRYCADIRIATDDGTFGTRGYVTDLAKTALKTFKPDAVCVCGPTPMLKAAQAIDFGCPVSVSMEARMGCGVGACLVCTCPVKKGVTVENVRVCIDGPVFSLADVIL